MAVTSGDSKMSMESGSRAIARIGKTTGSIMRGDLDMGSLVVSGHHTQLIDAVALTASGDLLATGSWDNTVKLWDPRTGRLLQTLEGHTSDVNAVALTANGDLLASGSDDNTVKLWDPRTGALIATLGAHAGPVDSVAFSNDGERVVSGSSDGTIKIWSVKRKRLIATIITGAPGEWLTYIPEGYYDGSSGMLKHTLRQVHRGRGKFPEHFLHKENPNPQKVAEALHGRLEEERLHDLRQGKLEGGMQTLHLKPGGED